VPPMTLSVRIAAFVITLAEKWLRLEPVRPPFRFRLAPAARWPLFPAEQGRRDALIAIGLVVLTFALRWPFRHIVNDDEAFFSVMGQRWLRGEWPYAASFDVKPPLLFALFAAAQAVFGMSLGTIKGMEIAFTAWGAVALQRMVRRHGSEAVSLWAGGLYPVYSLVLQGVSESSSVLQLPFVIAAFSCVLASGDGRFGRWRLFAGGLMIGLAGMIKQTAVFEAAGLGFVVLWLYRERQPARAILLYGLGAAVPVAAFAALFLAAGHLGDAYTAVIHAALVRMTYDPVAGNLAFGGGFQRILPLCKPLVVLSSLALFSLARSARIGEKVPGALRLAAVAWALSACAELIVQHAMFPYYAAMLIPPLLVLSGGLVMHGIGFSPRARGAAIAAVAAVAVAVPLWLDRATLAVSDNKGPGDFAAVQAAAAELKHLGVRPSDNILVLPRGLYLYVLTGALPSAPYYHGLHLICNFPLPDKAPLATALAGRPRFIVSADLDYTVRCELPQARQLIDDALRNYDLKAVTKGRWDRMFIYERKP